MSKTHDHHAIEAKWQAYWEEHRPFRAVEDATKPKFYCLDMFPYPSGSGLHVVVIWKGIQRRTSCRATNA